MAIQPATARVVKDVAARRRRLAGHGVERAQPAGRVSAATRARVRARRWPSSASSATSRRGSCAPAPADTPRLRDARRRQPVLHRRRRGIEDAAEDRAWPCSSATAPATGPRGAHLELLRAAAGAGHPDHPGRRRLRRGWTNSRARHARRHRRPRPATTNRSARSPSTTCSAAGWPWSTWSTAATRRVAFVGGPRRIGQVRDRLEGARQAWADAGLPPRTTWSMLTTDGARPSPTGTRGRRAARRDCRGRRRPTAAFCANDLLALGLLQQAISAGLRVPEDLAIVGYDDIEFAAARRRAADLGPPAAAAAGPHGRRAAARRGAHDPDHAHQQVQFTPELVARASTLG